MNSAKVVNAVVGATLRSRPGWLDGKVAGRSPLPQAVGCALALLGMMVFVLMMAVATQAAEPRRSGEMALVLDQGFPFLSKSGVPSRINLVFDLVCRDGAWQPEFWGTQMTYDRRYAVRYAYIKREVEGRIVSVRSEGTRTTFTVDVSLPNDIWGTRGGSGRYEVELTRSGDAFAGSYRGAFNGREATGTARGELIAPFNTPLPGATAIVGREHPRLVFRKADVPKLRERTQTPEGRAIMARLDAMLAEPHVINVATLEAPTESEACGVIAGEPDERGNLFIGLRERNGSGIAGSAWLMANSASTTVTLFLTDDSSGHEHGAAEAAATPAS